jgi:hypothetical protein
MAAVNFVQKIDQVPAIYTKVAPNTRGDFA